MGLYRYITEEETKQLKSINSNKELNSLFQEALKYHPKLLLEESYFYKRKKDYTGWLLRKREKQFSYRLYRESRGFDGDAYQAQYLFEGGITAKSITTYLYGVINGGMAVERKYNEVTNG